MALSRLVPHEIIEQVATLADAPDESALLLLGEVGIGKTYVLDELHQLVTVRSELVRTNPAESDYPLAGLSLFVSALNHDPERVHHTELDLQAHRADGMYSAANEILTVVRDLNLPPTLVLIDDIDLMDDDSRVLLGVIAGRLKGTSVRIVATATTIDATGPLAGFPTARLPLLSEDQMAELAAARVTDPDESTARIVAGFTGGNPGIMIEQLAQLERDQLSGEAPLSLPLPSAPSLDRVADSTISALTPAELEILTTVALAPSSHSTALAAVHDGGADVIEDLVGASVLHRHGEYVSIADPRVRTRLFWSMSSKCRRELHAEMAARTEAINEHLAAWHTSFGDPGHEGVDALLNGADWLISEGRIDHAVEFIERALGRVAHIEDHATAMIRLSNKLLRKGELGLAGRYIRWAKPDSSVPGQALTMAATEMTAHMFDSRVLIDDELKALVGVYSEANPEDAAIMLTIGAYRRAERWEFDAGRALLASTRSLDGVSELTREKLDLVEAILTALDGAPVSPDVDVEEERAKDAPTAPPVLLLQARLLTCRERYAEARALFNFVLSQPRARGGMWRKVAKYAIVGNEIAAGEFFRADSAIAELAGSPVVGRGTAAHM
ncbi:MAG: hypothetical protein QOJ72_1669, partial [Nocardioidaceae bacterium]|nr:hypothetical protein [Nocardioidaceae bacterium]